MLIQANDASKKIGTTTVESVSFWCSYVHKATIDIVTGQTQ